MTSKLKCKQCGAELEGVFIEHSCKPITSAWVVTRRGTWPWVVEYCDCYPTQEEAETAAERRRDK